MKIKLKNISVNKDKFKLNHINLEFNSGYVYALVGNNGSGKTTLIKTILGLENLSDGNIYFDQYNYKDNYIDIKSLCAVVPDEANFVHSIIKIAENIYLYDDRFSKEKFYDLLEEFEIDKHKKFINLSKGSQKKVLLALGLSLESKILILDEPTAHIDPKTKDKLLKILRDYMDDDKIIILSTHIISEVEDIADYVVILENGNIKLTSDIVSLQENNKDANHHIQSVEKIILDQLK